MKWLAIDPATTSGVAHSDGMLKTWTISSGGDMVHPGQGLEDLRQKLLRCYSRHPFGAIVYEQATLGSHPHQRRTAGRLAAIVGMVHWVAFRLNINVHPVAPPTLKLFGADHGHASKQQMVQACVDKYGINPANDNEADALHLLRYAEAGFPKLATAADKGKKKKASKTSAPKPKPF